jgi:nitroreductase
MIKEDTMTYFDEPVTDIIRRRCSWRSYSRRPVDQETMAKIKSFVADLPAPPFNSKVRFGMIVVPDKREGVKGTYGVIRGADTFIAGAVNENPRAMEDFGYQFEKTILFATSLGLGTCWLGGTFNRTKFSDGIGLAAGELIPAVTPVGYTAEKRTIIDKGFRLFAGSKNRLPFRELFFMKSFDSPLTESSAGRLAVPLEMVRLGPSASNKQPWRFVVDGDIAHLFLQRTKGYGGALPVDIQKIDIGIAMVHFELSAKEAGIDGRWIQADPGIKLPELAEYSSSWIPYRAS